MRKPTIYATLVEKLGRHPTSAELRAEIQRIKDEAITELAAHGKLRHQRSGR